MMLPTIHLNGSDPLNLLDGYQEAMAAVADAIAALRAITPHGRDYYPQGDVAIRDAQLENAMRIANLEAVRQELEAIALHISEQPQTQRRIAQQGKL